MSFLGCVLIQSFYHSGAQQLDQPKLIINIKERLLKYR